MFRIFWPRVAFGAAAILYAMSAFSATGTIVVENTGTFEYASDENGLAITFENANTHTRSRYRQRPFDECSAMSMYRVRGTAQVAIDGSCPSRGGEVFVHVYEWNTRVQDWCLIRQITGEKSDVPSGDYAGSREVARVMNCPRIGSDGSYSYESTEDVKKDIDGELAALKDAEKDKARLDRYLTQMPFYLPLEIAGYVGKIDVQLANDLGFFLAQRGRASDAIPLLQKIVLMYPGRVVAKLNLADALWESGQQAPARTQYSEYVSQMQNDDKRDRIPHRAFERLRQ